MINLKRRQGLLGILVHLLLLIALPLQTEAAVSGPDAFLDETLNYNVGFWLFRKSAEGSFTFKKHQKGYEAVFKAKTAGFLRIIVGKKTEYIRSVMEYDSDKKMFRTLMFEETFTDGGKTVRKEIVYDYPERVFEVSSFRNNKRVSCVKRQMPDETFVDLLTFFYNLRNGYYGKVGAGMNLAVCALVNSKPSYIKANVDKEGKLKKGTQYHFVISVDKKISAAGSKEMSSWFSKDLIPVYSVIKDAYYFGDLRIKLVEFISPRLSAVRPE